MTISTSSIRESFSIGFYFRAATGLLSGPGRFFKEISDNCNTGKPLGFLILSSLFYVGASFSYINEKVLLLSWVMLLNSIFMPLIGAAVSTGLVKMTSFGNRIDFKKIFSVYAFAGGITMLIAWIPLFWLPAELWRWGLVFTGFTKGCGLKKVEAFMITGVSILTIILFFRILDYTVTFIKNVF